MYNNKSFLLTASVLGTAAVTFAIAGCGGGNSATTALKPSAGATTADNGNMPAGRGRFAVTVRWPELPAETGTEPSRFIPLATQTLYFEMTELATGQKYPFIAVRRGSEGPGARTTTFEQFLPVGDYVLACVARPDDLRGELTGINLAVGATRLTINEGQTTRVPITLETTVASLSLSVGANNGVIGNTLRFRNSTPLLLEGRAADGGVIPGFLLRDNGLFRYEVTEGAGTVEVSPTGMLTPRAVGTATVRVTVASKPGVTADLLVAVVDDTRILIPAGSLQFLGQSPTRLAVSQSGTAPDTGVPADFRWESLNPAIATVTPDGFITPVALGIANLRVVSSGGQVPRGGAITDTFVVQIVAPETFAIANAPASLNAGQSVTLRAQVGSRNAAGGVSVSDAPARWEVVAGGEFAEINAETGELRGKPSNEGPQTVRVRATFVPTGAVSEANILINTYGGVNVGVD